MKKITIQLLLVLALTLAMLTGCSNPKENPSDGGAFAGELDLTGFSPEESIEMGVTIMLPDGMIENGTLLLGEYRILFGTTMDKGIIRIMV